MKNYPEIDWSYEADAIEDLAKRYVDVKKIVFFLVLRF